MYAWLIFLSPFFFVWVLGPEVSTVGMDQKDMEVARGKCCSQKLCLKFADQVGSTRGKDTALPVVYEAGVIPQLDSL